MQDDVYVISANGWMVASTLRVILKQKDDKGKEKYIEEHDIEVNKIRYKSDIIPPQLVIQRYFSEEQQTINAIQAEIDAIPEALLAIEEEMDPEDSLMDEIKNDSGKVVKVELKKVLKELKTNEHEQEAFLALNEYLKLMDHEAELKAELKTAKESLNQALVEKYQALTEDQIKTLVIHDKWLVSIEAGITSELDRVSQVLTTRIRQLAERYETPLPEIERRVKIYSERVAEHLKQMGYSV